MVHRLTDKFDELRFIPSLNTVVYSMAKGGSTSIWRDMYIGITGNTWGGTRNCSMVIQEPESSCWKSLVRSMTFYDIEERQRILSDPAVFKVAIIRHPFERLISSFKDKFMCNGKAEDSSYVPTKAFFVNKLRKITGRQTEDNSTCIDIKEFTDMIDIARLNVEQGKYSVDQIESHIRPQHYFLEEIDFDVVLDVKQWKSNYTVNSLAHKMPHKQLFEDAILKNDQFRHSNSHISLSFSEHDALKLFNFAALSSYGKHTYPLSS